MRVEACRCLKQDIPEVEAVIAALTPILEQWWLDAIEATLRRGDLLLGIEGITAARLPEIERLVGRTPDGRQRFEIEAELVKLLQTQIEEAVSSFTAAVAQEVEESRDLLLLDAALALGLSLEAETLAAIEAHLGPIRAGAVADLETLMRGRILTRRPEIKTILEKLARASTTPRASTASAGAAVTALTLREELRAILGAASPRSWVPFVADQWSYRWFNIGQFMTARDDGFTMFEAFNNPPRGPDAKTTPFCRFIHKRQISVQRAENQIRTHVRHALAGNIKGLMENWPLLPSELTTDRGPGADARHALALQNVGLPPYHARCRTVAIPTRIER